MGSFRGILLPGEAFRRSSLGSICTGTEARKHPKAGGGWLGMEPERILYRQGPGYGDVSSLGNVDIIDRYFESPRSLTCSYIHRSLMKTFSKGRLSQGKFVCFLLRRSMCQIQNNRLICAPKTKRLLLIPYPDKGKEQPRDMRPLHEDGPSSSRTPSPTRNMAPALGGVPHPDGVVARHPADVLRRLNLHAGLQRAGPEPPQGVLE